MEIMSGKGNQIYGAQDFSPPGEIAARKSNASSAKPSWSLTDAEIKRKKRLAKYKAYTLQGKVKSTFKNGFRWIKNKCSQIVFGY
ncbi:hypothetical protein V5N11_017724 [Cardamine amara subsp. amara]|uniref:DUF3511 domain protein n=1 Tax=Cardamine amara subsp. amara TaxID=228776 RepID=A0ABD1C9W3_CARAN